MKASWSALVLCLTLACAGQLWAAALPDSCGNDNVKFDVKTKEGQPAPAAPAYGKAQIVFIEGENQPIGPFMHATIRFGIDGAWAGANNGNSYFAANVDPGLHHLCASWQSDLDTYKRNVELTSFTAEPQQVYYFAAQVTVNSRNSLSFGFSPMNEDEGKYRVQQSKLSVSKAK
jgi:hypothetical protein